jgi:hypothetical protein
MISKVDDILNMNLNDDDNDYVEYGGIGLDNNGMINPYQHYNNIDGGMDDGKPPKKEGSNLLDKRYKSSNKKSSGSSNGLASKLSGTGTTSKLSSTGNFSLNSDGYSESSFAQSPGSTLDQFDGKQLASPINISNAESNTNRPRTSRRKRGDKDDADKLFRATYELL